MNRKFLYSLSAIGFLMLILVPLPTRADRFDQWLWRSPLPQGNKLNAIALGEDTIVAVGDSGTAITSSDGISWTVRTTPTSSNLIGIAYGDGIFVAVGDYGIILTSSDGISWTPQTSPLSDIDFTGIAYGNNAFVAVGEFSEGIITSPDGVNWSYYSLSNYNLISFTRITYSNNAFFIMGWENCIGFCTGQESIVYSSPNGVVWTGPEGSPPYPSIAEDGYGVVYGNGVYIKMSDSMYVGVSVSSDAVEWTQVYLPGPAWDVGNRIYFVKGTFIVVGLYGYIATSPNGFNWTLVTSRPWQYIKGIAYGNGTWVAVGGSTISTSADGISWTHQIAIGDTNHNLTGIVYGNNTFVAVKYDNILTSPDGKNWTQQSLGVFSGFQDIAFGNGIFVGLTMGNGSIAVMTSPDGVNWTTGPSGFGYGSRITFGNGIFAAIRPTEYGLVYTSEDGISWAAHSLGVSAALSDIAFGNNTFVVVGSFGSVFSSHDVVNWSATKAFIYNSVGGKSYNDLYSVAYGDGTFMAVGEGGAIFISPDGITWMGRKSVSHTLKDVSYVNHTFMVGYEYGTTSLPDGDMVIIGEVIQSKIESGDFNHDGQVNLTDAILSLQVTAGILNEQIIYKEADVGNGGKIGIAEMIYILQKLAGIR